MNDTHTHYSLTLFLHSLIFISWRPSFICLLVSARFVLGNQPAHVISSLSLQGNNESAIEQLRFDRLGRRGFVSFDEAFNCAKSQMIHPTLKSRYVGLILVMFVAVGDNRSFLDHLCYSFVSSTMKGYNNYSTVNI